MLLAEKVKATIRDVKDYPQPGIVFKDITPVLSSPLLVREITQALVGQLRGKKIDAIAAVEARGFILEVGISLPTVKRSASFWIDLRDMKVIKTVDKTGSAEGI